MYNMLQASPLVNACRGGIQGIQNPVVSCLECPESGKLTRCITYQMHHFREWENGEKGNLTNLFLTASLLVK